MAKINISKEFKTFSQGSAISFVLMGFIGVVNLAIRLLLQRNLSNVNYGFFYSALALVLLILSFSDLGLGQALTILTAKANKHNDKNLIKMQFTNIMQLKLLLAIILSLLILAFSPLIVKYYLHSSDKYCMFIVLLPAILFQSMNNGYTSFLVGLKKYALRNLLLLFVSLIWILLIFLTIFLFNKNVLLFASTYSLASLIVLLLTFFYFKDARVNLLKKASMNSYKKITKFCSYLAISTALLTSMYYLDTIMLTSLKGLNSSANYNMALPVMQIVLSAMVFVNVFTPIASELWVKKDYFQLKIFANIALLLAFAALPIVYFIFNYIGSDIIKLLYKTENYENLGITVTILCCGMVFFTLNNFLVQMLNSGHLEKKVAIITINGFIINLLLNFILIKSYDYNGAALATALTYFIMSVMSYLLIKKSIATYESKSKLKE